MQWISCVCNLLQRLIADRGNAMCRDFGPSFLPALAMHGLIHVIFRSFVVDKFGASAWKEILKRAGTLTEFPWWLEQRCMVILCQLLLKFAAKICFLRFLMANVVDLFYRSWNKWGIEDESTLFEMKHYDDSLTMAAVKIGAEVAGHESVTAFGSFAGCMCLFSKRLEEDSCKLLCHLLQSFHSRHIWHHDWPWPCAI